MLSLGRERWTERGGFFSSLEIFRSPETKRVKKKNVAVVTLLSLTETLPSGFQMLLEPTTTHLISINWDSRSTTDQDKQMQNAKNLPVPQTHTFEK